MNEYKHDPERWSLFEAMEKGLISKTFAYKGKARICNKCSLPMPEDKIKDIYCFMCEFMCEPIVYKVENE